MACSFKKCPLKGCENTSNTKGISFHKMPPRPEIQQQWKENLGLKPHFHYPKYEICTAHFYKKDLIVDEKKTFLKYGPNESIFKVYKLKHNTVPKRVVPNPVVVPSNVDSSPIKSPKPIQVVVEESMPHEDPKEGPSEILPQGPSEILPQGPSEILPQNVSLLSEPSLETDSPTKKSMNTSMYSTETEPSSEENHELDSQDIHIKESKRSYLDPRNIFEDVLLFVFLSKLMELFKICHHNQVDKNGEKIYCGSRINGRPEYFVTGFMITVETTCIKGHQYKWRSMPFYNRIPVGNVLISAAMLLGGNGWVDLESLKRLLNLVMPSRNSFEAMYQRFVYPIIHFVYEKHQNLVRDKLKGIQNLAFSTDGAIDNPGRGSGSICTTAAMDCGRVLYDDDGTPVGSSPGTNLIFGFQLTHVTETKDCKAGQMEPLGCEKLLNEISKDDRIKDWAVIVTDAHVSIPKIVEKFQPNKSTTSICPFEKMKIPQLKDELRQRKLPLKGSKKELLARLKNYNVSQLDGADTDDDSSSTCSSNGSTINSPPPKKLRTDTFDEKKLQKVFKKSLVMPPNKTSGLKYHSEEPWHACKTLEKYLRKAAKKKDCDLIYSWIKPLKAHFFYCLKNSKGNPHIAREMWVGCLFHVTNRHEWHSFKFINSCSHPEYTEEYKETVMFFKIDSLAYEALQDVIFHFSILKRLMKSVLFLHTTLLEIFHSKLRKYLPKRKAFSRARSYALTKVAIMSWNQRNAYKQKAVVKSSQSKNPKGTLRTKVQWSKVGGGFVSKQLYEYPEDHCQVEIMERALEFLKNPQHPTFNQYKKIDGPTWKCARLAHPEKWTNKDEIIKTHVSRL